MDVPSASVWLDADLVPLIRAGGALGTQAERSLVDRFAERIRLYGLRHLHDDDGARELVQEVLLVVLESIRAGKIEDPGRLASFILGTCRFVVWDGRRGVRRQKVVAEQAAAGEPVVSEPPWNVADTRKLESCLNRLPPREFAVVRMSFQEDRSAEDVAAALGLSAGNVRVIRHRALQHLQGCLDGDGEKRP